jgi:hypothetical protein
MSNKKITVNKKLLGKISLILSMNISLSDVKEFEEYDREKLFQESPEFWNEFEEAICEYQQRMQSDIMKDIKNLLENGNSR